MKAAMTTKPSPRRVKSNPKRGSAAEIDDDHAHEADQAARKSAQRQAVVRIKEMRHEDAEEDPGRVHDGRLHAGGVGQTDVEEDVLDHGLGQAQQGDLPHLPRIEAEHLLSETR